MTSEFNFNPFEYSHQRLQRLAEYDQGEAASVVKILLEDGFGLRLIGSLPNKTLSIESWALLETYLNRLISGEPLQYILGYADFMGLKIKVEPGVLIPRQETEELVDLAIRRCSCSVKNLRILDIGTGSGCIALSVKKKCPNSEVTGVDVSEKALEIASINAQDIGIGVNFSRMDLLNVNSWTQFPIFDVIISNPPYIPPSEAHYMPPRVLNHEPHIALFVPEDDSLLFYRMIATFCATKLSATGQLFVECNEFNAQDVHQLFLDSAIFSSEKVEIHQDIMGKNRIVSAKKENQTQENLNSEKLA